MGKQRYTDITGQKFGPWTVEKHIGSNKNKSALWLCKNDRGEIKKISTVCLRMIAKRYPHRKRKSVIGKKFGRLTVKKWAGKYKSTFSVYQCECECGEIKNIRYSDLRSGATRSCGCLQKESQLKNIGKRDTKKFATNIIEKIIKKNGENGAGIKEVRKATDYDDYKIYLTLHRLRKAGRIKRIAHGTYIKDD